MRIKAIKAYTIYLGGTYGEKEAPALFAEGQCECLPDKLVRDGRHDWKALLHLHLDLFRADHGDVRVPGDGGLVGVRTPIDDAGLGHQVTEPHGLHQSLAHRRPRLGVDEGVTVVSQVRPDNRLGRRLGGRQRRRRRITRSGC